MAPGDVIHIVDIRILRNFSMAVTDSILELVFCARDRTARLENQFSVCIEFTIMSLDLENKLT